VTIPLAVKIGPFFSSVGHVARRLVSAGADGLVLFNRFMQPDIDLETMSVDPTLHLSTAAELLLPLRWVAILRDRVDASLASTTGVHTSEDAIKMLLVGADAVMVASTLLRNGPDYLAELLEGVERWLDEHGYASVEQAKGSMSQRNVANPIAFERSNYAQAVTSFVSPYDWRMASEPQS
jgi:dihydroorotate dehydrogenase (fumarate)